MLVTVQFLQIIYVKILLLMKIQLATVQQLEMCGGGEMEAGWM